MSKKSTAIVKHNKFQSTAMVKGSKEFGQIALAAAQEEVNEGRKKACVDTIAAIIRSVDEAEASIVWSKRCKEFFQRKLRALDAGAFDYDGVNNRLIFHVKELNLTQPERFTA